MLLCLCLINTITKRSECYTYTIPYIDNTNRGTVYIFAMHLVSIIAILVFAMPITGFGWTESANLLIDPYLICKKPRRLRGKYHEMCKNETFMMRDINRGIGMGFKECEYQFRNRRWNCTSIGHHMKKILLRDTRETSFVSAITAAGITYAVTRACSTGDLVECSCDKNRIIQQHLQYNAQMVNDEYNIDLIMKQRNGNTTTAKTASNKQFQQNENRQYRKHSKKHHRRRHNTNTYLQYRNIYRNVILPEGDWQWGGCGDNVMYGFRKSKEFLDSRYRRRSDIRTLVKLHNNNAGRLAVKSLMRLECKCHGLSGSCVIRTCWMRMAPFRDISNRLKEHFDGAAKVIARNDGHSFMAEGLTIKPPTRHDLIYTDDSLDFCQFNAKTGSLGTRGRECNATSAGIDGCDLLCCNRGYDHKIIREKVSCRCTFKWCCDVTCSTCIEKRELFTCR